MKVVINRCYGGFGLSDAALIRYFELKGMKMEKRKEPGSSWENWWDVSGDEPDYWYSGNIERTDPALVQVVEELGEAASGSSSKLKVVEVPDVTWQIEDYDGMEKVRQVSSEWY